jgi:hypothetical protein
MAFVYLLDPKIFQVATGRGLPTERRPFLGVIGEQGQNWRVYHGKWMKMARFTLW